MARPNNSAKFSSVGPHFSKKIRRTLATCLLVIATPSTFIAGALTADTAAAQGASFTSADLLLKDVHGPWLILATTFEGPESRQKAVQLAAELRKEHGLTAYCSPKKFDYSQTLQGVGMTETGHTRKMRYRNDEVIETCAVLIGNFDSMDGKDIDEALIRVKSIAPKFLGEQPAPDPNSETVSTKDFRNYLRKISGQKETASESNAPTGPMRFAFKTRNPLLPAEYYQSPEVDRFVRQLNQEAPLNTHNLIDCKKKFTVRVLTLRGSDGFVSWGRSSEVDSQTKASELELAAERAHLVTKTLRLAGYEAYQFHDRHQSIVCVGSFDELGQQNAQGQFQYAPEILEVVRRFAGTGNKVNSKFGQSEQPRLLLDDIVDSKIVPELKSSDRKTTLKNFQKLTVAFDLVPTPIMAPKTQSSAIYNSYTFGK